MGLHYIHPSDEVVLARLLADHQERQRQSQPSPPHPPSQQQTQQSLHPRSTQLADDTSLDVVMSSSDSSSPAHDRPHSSDQPPFRYIVPPISPSFSSLPAQRRIGLSGKSEYDPWNVRDLVFSYTLPKPADSPVSNTLDSSNRSGFSKNGGSTDLRDLARKLLSKTGQVIHVTINGGILDDLVRIVEVAFPAASGSTRPDQEEVDLLGRMTLALSGNHAAMAEEHLHYEAPIQGALLLGPCRAANLVSEALNGRRALAGQTAPCWGITQQAANTVTADLSIFPLRADGSGANGEIKSRTALSDDKMESGLHGVGQGFVIRAGNDQLEFVDFNGEPVDIPKTFQKVLIQIFLESHSSLVNYNIVTNGSGSFVSRLAGPYHLELSPFIPRENSSTGSGQVNPRCTLFIALVALLFRTRSLSENSHYLKREIADIKQEQRREKKTNKGASPNIGSLSPTPTPTSTIPSPIVAESRSNLLVPPTSSRSEMMDQSQGSNDLNVAFCFLDRINIDFDPYRAKWERCRGDQELSLFGSLEEKAKGTGSVSDSLGSETEDDSTDLKIPFTQNERSVRLEIDSQPPIGRGRVWTTLSGRLHTRVKDPSPSSLVLPSHRRPIAKSSSARLSAKDAQTGMPMPDSPTSGSGNKPKKLSAESQTSESSSGSTLVNSDISIIPVAIKVSIPSTVRRASDDMDTSLDEDVSESDLYNPEEAVQAIINEADLYLGPLAKLQGSTVPRFYGLWKTQDKYGEELWIMVLELLSPLRGSDTKRYWMETKDLEKDVQSSIISLYQQVHSVGVTHNDHHMRHVMTANPESTSISSGHDLRLVDFDAGRAHSTDAQCLDEMEQVMKWLGVNDRSP